MTDDIRAYYDEQSRQWAKQYACGNRRLDRQRELFAHAIPRDAKRILIVGCGTGDAAHHIATRIARSAQILATDLSGRAIRLARKLHPHPRVTYQSLDVPADEPSGTFDVIVLPDVYEHIPIEKRSDLHARLSAWLTARSMLILTVPSPAHQQYLKDRGEGLQIIDETVTLDEIVSLARDIGGTLTYFNSIHVWHTNDYFHAVIERGDPRMKPLSESDYTRLKVGQKPSWLDRIKRLTGIGKPAGILRRRRIERLLRDESSQPRG